MTRGGLLFLVFLFTFTVAGAEPLTVTVRESVTLQIPGATAAYAVDGAIADAAAAGGTVTIFGRGPGETQVVVVAMGGTRTFPLIVKSRINATAAQQQRSNERATVETRYTTSQNQLQNSVSVIKEEATRKTEVRATHVAYGGSEHALREATVRITTPQRELTFFDDTINNSPLTVWGTSVRGAHYRQGGFRAHAGYTSTAFFQSLLLPAERHAVVGASYAYRLSARATLMPSLFLYPSHGTVASLTYDYAKGEELFARGEVGYSRVFGAAAQLSWLREHERLRLDVRYQPRAFASINPLDLHGFYADGSWSRQFNRRLATDVAVSANRYELPRFEQRTLTAQVDARYALTNALSLVGGANYGSFEHDRVSARTYTIPLGLRADFARFGFALVPRYAASSLTNDGGFGFRASARASLGRGIHVSAYADRQDEAATLQLLYRTMPDLPLALEQLGIAATSPQEIARALRENAALIQLGFIDGAAVNLSPSRTQAGLELGWLGQGSARHQLRLRALFNRVEDVTAKHETTLATLTYSRRLDALTDVYAAVSHWRSDRDEQQFVEAGVRKQFDRFPEVFSASRGGTISGVVFADDAATGEYDRTQRGIANVELELDGSRRVQTTADGRFTFADVPRGQHRLTARVSGDASAYFTTSSRVTVEPGEVVNFGISHVPARATGFVRDDAGRGIAGVTVTLVRGSRRIEEVTSTDGKFSVATAPGEYEVTLDAATLPVGYSVTGGARRIALDRGAPLPDVDFALRANRSVSGKAPANAELEILELGRKVRTSGDGAYTFRSLPPGELTLVARKGAERLTKKVTLPETPVALKGIDLESGVTERVARKPSPARAAGKWIVQLGAFRLRSNADATIARARRAGVQPVAVPGTRLIVVEAGPFASRDEAVAVQQQLAVAGVEAVVMTGQ
ncbi:MAG TPA: SPOR domain-containing protein [Thermoanaerobaculia bacterium]